MNNRLYFQRRPAVRLRREGWGGLAFDRTSGDLLELDAEGFAALAVLAMPRTLRGLRAALRAQGLAGRLPELARFVQALDDGGFLRRLGGPGPALAPRSG
ncbi:MAG: hypothetical protein IRY99_05870 [Isosphaeraceae bacterium]|nr:hypothetical protein [Isosphaeraceae bacterium]